MADRGGPSSGRAEHEARWAIGLVVLLLVLVLMSNPLALGDAAPSFARRQVRQNGEAWMFAALMIVRLADSVYGRLSVRRGWLAFVVGGLVATSSVGHWLDLPGWIMTLREPFAASALVALYLRFPLRHRRLVVPYVLVVAITVASELSVIENSRLAVSWRQHAETIGMLLLTAVLVDVMEPRPRVLGRPAPSWMRAAWCTALLAAAVGLMVVHPDGVAAAEREATTSIAHLRLWALRNLESLLAVSIVSVWLFASAGASPTRSIDTDRSTHGWSWLPGRRSTATGRPATAPGRVGQGRDPDALTSTEPSRTPRRQSKSARTKPAG